MKKDIFCFCVIFGLGFVSFSHAQLLSFHEQIVINLGIDEPMCVYAADLDNDGDLDVLSASDLDGKIAWYENKGQGMFSNQRLITTNVKGVSSVYVADLDNDGDMDVVFASYTDGKIGEDKIGWYANMGQGSFSGPWLFTLFTRNADKPRSVYAADLDNDGDMDVLSGEKSKIAWYRNGGGPSSVFELSPVTPGHYFLFSNYPNPFNMSTRFSFGLPVESRVSLEVYDGQGRKVSSVLKGASFPAGVVEWEWEAKDGNGNALPSGVYFVYVEAEPVGSSNRFQVVRKVVLIK